MAKCLSGRIKTLENEVFEIMQNYMQNDAECVTCIQSNSIEEETRCFSAPTGSSRILRYKQSTELPTQVLYAKDKQTITDKEAAKSMKPNSGKKTSNKSNKPPVNSPRLLQKPVQSERDSASTAKNKPKKTKKLTKAIISIRRTPKRIKQTKNTSNQKPHQTISSISECLDQSLKIPSEILCNCFEEPNTESIDSLEKLRNDLAQVKSILKDKVERMQTQAFRSMRKIAKDNARLNGVVEERDGRIRALEEAGEMLRKECEVKDEVCRRMAEEHGELKSRLVECVEGNSCLASAKDKLARIVDEQQIRIDALVIEVDRLKSSLTKDVRVEDVAVDASLDGSSSSRREKDLEKQVVELRQSEISYLEELEKCKNKMARLKCDQNCSKSKYEKKLQGLQNENASLLAANRQLIDRMKHENSELVKKSDIMQLEFRKMSQVMKNKEITLLKERDQLKNLARELTDITKKQNQRIDELITLNQMQENELRKQKAEMEDKINSILSESEILRKQFDDLKREYDQYRSQSVDAYEFDSVIKELDDAKESLRKLSETVAMKEMINQEQASTVQQQRLNIQELRAVLERRENELTALQQEMKNTSNRLAQEIGNNANIKKTLLEVHTQNEILLKKVGRMPADSLKCAGDGNPISTLMATIEERVASQRREWEMERQLIYKEKIRAETAAQFTTKKLLETSIDMQKNAAMHRHVQHLLISLLQDKEEQLQMVRQKVTNMNSVAKKTPKVTFSAPDSQPFQTEDKVIEHFQKAVYRPPQCKIYNPRPRSRVEVTGSSGSSVYASTMCNLSGKKGRSPSTTSRPSHISTSLIFRNLNKEQQSCSDCNCLLPANGSIK